MQITSKQLAALANGTDKNWDALESIDLAEMLKALAEVPDFAVADVRGLQARIERGPTQWMLLASNSDDSVYIGIGNRDLAMQKGVRFLHPKRYPAGTVLSGRVYPHCLTPALYPDGKVEVEA